MTPWIVFSVLSAAFYNLQIPLTLLLAIVGVLGMIYAKPRLALASSLGILIVLVWGRLYADLSGTGQTDTALLLLQFVLTILLMEGSANVIRFSIEYGRVRGKDDELSQASISQLAKWMGRQLSAYTRFGLAAYGLSLGLLVGGTLASIPVNHLAVLSVLVLASVVALLFLLTYNREPEEDRSSR